MTSPTSRVQPPLTPRELETLRLLAQGYDADDIARLLAIAQPSVRRHLSNAYAKLGVHKAAHAIAVCYEAGILGGQQ